MANQTAQPRCLPFGSTDRPFELNGWDYVDLDFLCLYIASLGDKEVSQAIRDGMPSMIVGAHRYATWKVVRERWPQLVTGKAVE